MTYVQGGLLSFLFGRMEQPNYKMFQKLVTKILGDFAPPIPPEEPSYPYRIMIRIPPPPQILHAYVLGGTDQQFT